jgi:uncharacterized protein
MKKQPDIASRIASLDWARLGAEIGATGAAPTGPLLTAKECDALRKLYDDDARFRTKIVMARHGFGAGEYKYLAYPLPDLVGALRTAFYPRLASIANLWAGALGAKDTFPDTLDKMLARCHAAGQARPTPLMLSYGAGDYNCLHQDLYGAHVFPIQVVILLSQPGEDFSGGEFVVVEQRPRMQSKAEVVTPARGEAIIFATHHRPKHGAKGVYRVTLRHGVSRVRSGKRQTLGLIFHDST